jgi:Rps23 Pro-64 3,4-dihydroxylase Tpa1-like proline 4-hydroxylase
MKIGKGYIVGTGNEFFGPDYENILEKVSNVNYVGKNYCVFYSIGEVKNVNRTEMMSYEMANLEKERLIREEKDLVQIWLYDYSFGEKTIINYAFPTLEKTWGKYKIVKNGFELALYNKGCFIKDHNDGLHIPRVCALICYLTKNWEKGMGGELYITDLDGNRIEVEPKFGNVAILNFKEANLQHEVMEITDNNLLRTSLIQIISEDETNY